MEKWFKGVLALVFVLLTPVWSEQKIKYAIDAKETTAILQEACGNGVAKACFNLAETAMRVERKSFYAPLPSHIEALYLKGCEGGEERACYRIGFRYFETKEYPKALHYLDKACRSDLPIACSLVSAFYYQKENSQNLQSYPKALEYSLLACKSHRFIRKKPLAEDNCNDAEELECHETVRTACADASMMLQDGLKGIPVNYPKSKTLAKPYCPPHKAGNRFACTAMGNLYKNGWGLPKDLTKALIYYKSGCSYDGDIPCEEARRLEEMGIKD